MTDVDPTGRPASIQVAFPAGWDGRITVGRDGDVQALHSLSGTPVRQERPQPVVHLANFGLPEARGDFGGGAVELMGNRDVFVVLFEYEPAATETPLFAAVGMPRTLAPRDFDVTTLRRGIAGQSGVQIFFQEAGRAFCLYVVLGTLALKRARAPAYAAATACFLFMVSVAVAHHPLGMLRGMLG